MNATLMSCPKCGHEQAHDFPECVRCGVVFAKFQPPEVTPDQEPAGEHQPMGLPDAYDVENAYVPSGSVSVSGLLMLVMGSVIGIGAGVICGVLAWFVGGGAVKMLVGLSGVLYEFLEVPVVLLLATVFAAFVAYMFRVLVVGWVVAFVIAQFGKLGKNRNVPVAAFLALGTGGFAGMLLVSAAPQFLQNLDVSTVEALELEETGGLIAGLDSLSGAMAYWGQDGKTSRALNIVAAILAALLASFKTADDVSKQKFCEKCSAYMVSKLLGLSSWQEAQRVAVAHWQKNFARLKNLLRVGWVRVRPRSTCVRDATRGSWNPWRSFLGVTSPWRTMTRWTTRGSSALRGWFATT